VSRAEAIIDRLHALHPKLIDLSLGRMHRVLAALGHPERRLPPVVHVAGTNGKGSTCAFLRAIAEAAGQRVHVYTSPHLVRFHERIRLAGRLVEEAALTQALEHVEAANGGEPITVFEVTTAVALHLFATVPADLLVLEVGLGGRLDATNVVDRPAATAITSVSMDHMDFLGDTLGAIAVREGRHHQARRALRDGRAGARGRGGDRSTGGRARRTAALARAAVGHRAAGRRNARLPRRPRRAAPAATRPAGTAPGGQCRHCGGRAARLEPPLADRGRDRARRGRRHLARAHAAPARTARRDAAAGLGALAGWRAQCRRGARHRGAPRHRWTDRPAHVVAGIKAGKQAPEFLRPILPHAATLWAVREKGQHLAMAPEAIVAASGGAARHRAGRERA
jgi:dihydrofolate synthase/folylpolyglutamate synthase